MTTTSIFLRPDIAYLLTDAACWSRGDAAPNKFVRKVELACDGKIAVMAHGWEGLPKVVAGALSAMQVPIELLVSDDGLSVMKNLSQHLSRKLEVVDRQELLLYIIGWSSVTGRAEGVFSQVYGEDLAVEAHNMRAPGKGTYWGSPMNEGIMQEAAMFGFDFSRVRPVDVDPVRHGIIVMEAQRRAILPRRSWDSDDIPQTQTGGFVDLTTIGPGGIHTKTIHRWPDKVGERLQIEPFEVALARHQQAAGMTRKQRRAMEAQRSKRH